MFGENDAGLRFVDALSPVGEPVIYYPSPQFIRYHRGLPHLITSLHVTL